MGLESGTTTPMENRKKYSIVIFLLVMGELILLSLSIALGTTYLAYKADRDSYKNAQCFVQNIQMLYSESCYACDTSESSYVPPAPAVPDEEEERSVVGDAGVVGDVSNQCNEWCVEWTGRCWCGNIYQRTNCGSGCSNSFWEVDFLVSYYISNEQINATIKETYNDDGSANTAMINHYFNNTYTCYYRTNDYYQIDWNLPHSNYLIIGICGLVSIIIFMIILFFLVCAAKK